MVGFIEEGKKVAKKQMELTLHGLWGPGVASPLRAEIFTASGAPAVSTPVLRSLAGKPGAAKKALLELEGQDASADSSDLFDGAPPCCLCPCARTPSLQFCCAGSGPTSTGGATAPFFLCHARLPSWPDHRCAPDVGVWSPPGAASLCKACAQAPPFRCTMLRRCPCGGPAGRREPGCPGGWPGGR